MKISYPGIYQGYTATIYDSYVRHSVYVPVRDGTRLAVDYLIPAKAGVEQADKFPIVLQFTPYNRCNYGSGLRTYDMESYDYDGAENSAYMMTSHGYVFAKADVRGTGASYGARVAPNNEQECMDGYDIVEWLAVQPFSNGKVGMIGSSYTGQTQLEVIRMRPPHLTAVCIGNTNIDAFDGWMRGGIISDFGNDDEEELLGHERQKTVADRVFETVPVDEDKNSSMLRDAIIEQSTGGLWEHLFDDLHYRDSVSGLTGTRYLEEISPSRYLDDINASGVAVYILAGMYDPYRRDAFLLMKNLTVPKKMAFGSWYHCYAKNDPDWPIEHIRWFDHWLKGIENGITDEPPYFLKCENDQEKDAFYQEWPVEAGSRETFILDDSGNLVKESDWLIKENDRSDRKPSGIRYQAVYGIRTSTEDYYAGEMDDPDKVLVSRTEPLREDRVFVGHPMVELCFQMLNTTEKDIDFYIVLSDYDPVTKQSHIISDGRLRASFRKTGEAHYDFLGLPWHPGRECDIQMINDQEEYEITIDLMPVSYEIKAGHELHMGISNAMGCFDYLHRKEYEDGDLTNGPEWLLITDGRTRLEMPDIYSCKIKEDKE